MGSTNKISVPKFDPFSVYFLATFDKTVSQIKS